MSEHPQDILRQLDDIRGSIRALERATNPLRFIYTPEGDTRREIDDRQFEHYWDKFCDRGNKDKMSPREAWHAALAWERAEIGRGIAAEIDTLPSTILSSEYGNAAAGFIRALRARFKS